MYAFFFFSWCLFTQGTYYNDDKISKKYGMEILQLEFPNYVRYSNVLGDNTNWYPPNTELLVLGKVKVESLMMLCCDC